MVLPLIVLLAILPPVALTGCWDRNGGESPVTEQQNEDYAFKVGFSLATLLEDRWLLDRDVFIAEASQRNVEVIMQNANMDSAQQLTQVKEMLDQGIDVLVIVPNDDHSAARCVQAAKEKGVPVVMYDRLVREAGGDVYISFDNVKVGALMAEYLLEAAPSGGYILVNGPENDYNTTMIKEGYMKTLEPHIAQGEITILTESWTESWVREKAYDFVSENLEEYADQVTAVLCQNDSLAWGVIDALSEARILHSVEVVGMDADLAACQRIVKGIQGMTVYKPIPLLVEETLSACEALAAGERIVTDRTIDDGRYQVPYIAIDVKMVTRETMDETVITDGFHLREDVYEEYYDR